MSEEIRNQAAPEAAVEEAVSEETLSEQRRIRREKMTAMKILMTRRMFWLTLATKTSISTLSTMQRQLMFRSFLFFTSQ